MDKKNGIQEVGRTALNVQTHNTTHARTYRYFQTQSTWSVIKGTGEVAASMALPGSIEIVRLGAQSGDLNSHLMLFENLHGRMRLTNLYRELRVKRFSILFVSLKI